MIAFTRTKEFCPDRPIAIINVRECEQHVNDNRFQGQIILKNVTLLTTVNCTGIIIEATKSGSKKLNDVIDQTF